MQAACSSARSSRWQIPTAMVSASATTTSDPIAHKFAALAEQRRKALVAYITAGHPDRARSLALVRLVAPTTPAARMAEIARHGSGFVYLISRLGVTGARDDVPAELPATVARLRSAASLPICVGFGIARPEQAVAVGRLADGVAVGSALVRHAGESVAAAAGFIASLRAALDADARG